jgi:hypothetical protein
MNSFPILCTVSFGLDEQSGGDEAEDGSAALPHQPQAIGLRQEGKSRESGSGTILENFTDIDT